MNLPHKPCYRTTNWKQYNASLKERGSLPEDEVLESLTGDGAYDTQPVHEAVMRRGAIPVTPPHKNARTRKGAAFVYRNAAIAACRRLGRDI